MYEVSANAVVGIKVDRNKFYANKLVRNCSHVFPKEFPNPDYCPFCGNKSFRSLRSPIPEFNEFNMTINTLPVFATNGANKEFIVGSSTPKVSRDSYDKFAYMNLMGYENLINLKNIFKEKLEPIGLWNETFGIYVVIYDF